MMSPAYPAATACGLITQQVQLEKSAVGFISLEKNKFISAAFCWKVPGAWTAFLTPSVPKADLMEEEA